MTVAPVAVPAAIWYPFSEPCELMLPVAFTERTADQPAVVVGAVEEYELPSVEYESVHPFGYLMSEIEVSFTIAGSIDWTIS